MQEQQQETSRGAAQAVLTEASTMPAQIEVSITVGGRAVKVAADAQVDALVPPSWVPGVQPVHGEPDQEAVKNAGMTVMSAALDALFSGRVRRVVDEQSYDTFADSQARP